VWTGRDFYRASIDAAQRLGRHALLLVGDMRNVPDKLPDGIAAFEYAPHNQVMPRSAVIVHPGGIGTTGQALRAGKPALIVPHGQDQPDNARRCAQLGLARPLRPRQYTVDRVVAELRILLENRSYTERSEESAKIVASENGTANAASLIEKVLNG
jgi:rhamnosyltransferase subunit B